MTKTYSLDNKNIEVDNEDKIFFEKDSITKGDLIDYYQKIYKLMSPHLKDRPISMERCPDGINKECFYHKEAPKYFPDWIETAKIRVKEEQTYQQQVVINDKAALVYLVGQGMVTPHTWLSKKDNNYKPDKIIFDLDPAKAETGPPHKKSKDKRTGPAKNNFELVKLAAKKIREEFEKRELKSFVMTTGSKGLHIVIPIRPQHSFNKIRYFSKKIANNLAKKHDDKFTTKTSKAKRKGRLFLDYLRNSYGQTSVAPYSVRTIKDAPIATPIDWDELDDPDLTAQKYTIKNILKRTTQVEDPWNNYKKTNNKIIF